MLQIIIAALFIMAVSLVGVLFTQKTAGAWLDRNLGKLTSFAGGVFLVTSLVLALEVFHLIESRTLALGLIILGYALAWAMHFIIPESHHHHDDACGKSAKKLIMGDAIHNIGDGIILVPAFLVSTGLGWTVAVSIVIHEAIQEVSEFFILRRAGYSVKKALTINLLVSSTILIGVAIGLLALATTNLEGVLLALTAGFFLHVVIHDLIPVPKDNSNTLWGHALLVLIGAGVMFGVNTALGDSHVHGDGHAHGEEHHDEHHDEHHEEHAHDEKYHDEAVHEEEHHDEHHDEHSTSTEPHI